jgi:hypothetical protein
MCRLIAGSRRWKVLRRGPVNPTGKALVAALGRVAQVAGIGVGTVDVAVVPQRRLVDLARRGMAAHATDLRRTRPYSKRLAALLATVVYLEAKAVDDALELFDVIMTSGACQDFGSVSNSVVTAATHVTATFGGE